MKNMVIWAVTLSVALAACLPAMAQSDLETKIERIFLYQPVYAEKYDRRTKIEELGRAEEVQAILLKMLIKYKYSEPETKEAGYLTGATWMLGAMEVKQAVGPLSQMLFDRKVHENVRALAARSLGQIDPEGNKQSLLKALANVSDYHLTRIYAAEALAKTKDAQVLTALERYSREERDPYVRQKFEKAAKELRTRTLDLR